MTYLNMKNIPASNFKLIDLDGTLTKEVCFTQEEALTATPNLEAIKKVNKAYESEIIIIYTARRKSMRDVSELWLHIHGVHYHAYVDGKFPGQIVDSDAIKPRDL